MLPSSSALENKEARNWHDVELCFVLVPFLGLLFNSEDGCDMLLHNVG
jgi:hypothetical protein